VGEAQEALAALKQAVREGEHAHPVVSERQPDETEVLVGEAQEALAALKQTVREEEHAHPVVSE